MDRQRETSQAKRLLSSTRLLTLTGVGGVGKTRLALRVAVGVRRAFTDGVWLVELAALQDRTLLEQTVADTVGLRDRSTRSPREVVVGYLRDKQLLLVLDNCEHLVDRCAGLAADLLAAAPGLRILATSRHALHVSGEHILAVPPLPLPDPDRTPPAGKLLHEEAIHLFTERATAVRHDFAVTAGNHTTIARICRRLDGLPLAIELAAARLRVLSPEQILARLDDRFRLLRGGSQTVLPRHQTLRAVVDWSYELCSPLEQMLWARVSVFAGGFDLDAAEEVCAGAGIDRHRVLDLVVGLVDESILIKEDPDQALPARYRLLDTIAHYGREVLRAADGEAVLRRRHRDWYAELVARAEAEWISSRQVDWFACLEREYPNLRAALEFCLTEPGQAGHALRMATSLFPYWFGRGLLSEGRYWLDRALAQQPRPCVDRVHALYANSMLAGQQNDLLTASTLVEEGQQVAEQLGDASTRALFTLASGWTAGYRGELARSVALLEVVLDTFRAEDNLPRLLDALFALTVYSGGLGDAARAVACHQEVLAITEPRGEVWYRSLSLWAAGLAVWQQGHLRRATGLVRESLRLKRPINDLLGTAWCLEALAWIAAAEPDPRRAATLLGAATELWHALGTSPGTVRPLLGYHDECGQRTRRALGERAFQAVFRRGVSLSVADAIGYALDEKPQVVPSPAGAAETLTGRERQVADLVAEGLSDKDIAGRLVIAQRTAEGHVQRVLTKLGFTKRTQLAAWIIEERKGQDR